MFMMRAIAVFASVAVLVTAGTALAGPRNAPRGPSFHLMAEMGVATYGSVWDADGQALDGAATTDLPMAIGAGLKLRGVGTLKLALTMLHRRSGDESRFGVRELRFGINRPMKIGRNQVLDIDLGFKLDVAPLPKQGSSPRILLSNDTHAATASVFYRYKVTPRIGIRFGTDFVLNMEAEDGFQQGMIFNPELGLRFYLSKQGTLGLDLGVLAYTANVDRGVKIEGSSGYAMHITPSLRWRLTRRQTLLLSVESHFEDYSVGFPLVGASFPAAHGFGANLRYILSL